MPFHLYKARTGPRGNGNLTVLVDSEAGKLAAGIVRFAWFLAVKNELFRL